MKKLLFRIVLPSVVVLVFGQAFADDIAEKVHNIAGELVAVGKEMQDCANATNASLANTPGTNAIINRLGFFTAVNECTPFAHVDLYKTKSQSADELLHKTRIRLLAAIVVQGNRLHLPVTLSTTNYNEVKPFMDQLTSDDDVLAMSFKPADTIRGALFQVNSLIHKLEPNGVPPAASAPDQQPQVPVAPDAPAPVADGGSPAGA